MGADGPTAPGGAEERSDRALELLRAAADPTGFLPFDRFLEIALYDPEVGYYTRPDLRLGRKGDFYTAPHVHPMFGRTLARRILAEYRRLGRPSTLRIVEVGPGDGTMASDILDSIPRLQDPPDRLEYVLVGPSAASTGPVADRLRVADRPGVELQVGSGLSGDGPFVGVVLAHELLDSMPFRRIVRRGNGWNELGVSVSRETLKFREGPLVRPVQPPPLSDAPEGTVLELSEAAEGWIRELADQLVDGVALVVDYGAEERDLMGRGAQGTLAAVRRHRTGLDPLESPGYQDLSAFVNFSRIRRAAASAGLREVAFHRQADALGNWGIETELAEAIRGAASAEEEVRIRLGAKSLLFGFDSFFALELSPGGAPLPR